MNIINLLITLAAKHTSNILYHSELFLFRDM